jgi:ABC-2 type transport system permease protein
MIRRQSFFKLIFVLCFATLFETGLCWLFFDAFNYLHRLGGVGLIIINKLFTFFFLGMGLMMAVSNIVSSYSTIYRSEEIPFLVTRPFTSSQVILYKFFESAGLSSWAFFFIIIPFVGSYAYHERLPVAFAAWNLLFSVPFLILCCGIGTIITMLFVRWIPLGKSTKMAGILLSVLVLYWIIRELRVYRGGSAGDSLNLALLLPGFSLAANPLLPSWWVSEGIMAFTREQWFRGTMLFGVTISSAMLVCVLIEWVGARIFYDGWLRLAGASANANRRALALQYIHNMMTRLPNDIRAIAMKDIRTFLRDPIQWSQALIFFGLLALYFSNLRAFRYHTFPEDWRNTIAFLNVFSVSAVICSLGSRFIYPQLSLEGQGFWIIGLSPARMSRILLTKFFMSLIGMTAVSVSLMLLSSRMLNASTGVTAAGVILACAISFAVCGLSTGLGAVFLDLNQRNPAAIVSGFGGTLNLVLSLGFMLAAIIPFAFAFRLHLVHKINGFSMHMDLLILVLWLVFITGIAVLAPLYLGLRSLLNREF